MTYSKIKVLVFGTYNKLHKGHKFFLSEAKKFGDELIVVVARNKTVLELKKYTPEHEEIRRKNVEELEIVDKAILGDEELDKYKVIDDVKPDIIVLGYDQYFFTKGLLEELLTRGHNLKIIRLDKAFMPEKYKSSLL